MVRRELRERGREMVTHPEAAALVRCPVVVSLGLGAANSYTWVLVVRPSWQEDRVGSVTGSWRGGGRGASGPRWYDLGAAQVADLCGDLPASQVLYSLLPSTPRRSVVGTIITPIYRLEN